MTSRTIARRIQEIMKKHDISQTEFGRRIGESPQSVYKWANGIAEPRNKTLRQISKVFQISFDHLMNDEVQDSPSIPAPTTEITETGPVSEQANLLAEAVKREIREAHAVYQGTWLTLAQAARYCNMSVVYFNKQIRPYVPNDKASRPVIFRREKLDAAMEARQIGNLPSPRGSTSTALRKEGSKRGL